jgi:hypothetical protein
MGICIIPIMPPEYSDDINVWFAAFIVKNRQKIRSSLHRVYGFGSYQLHANRKLSYNTEEKATVVIFSSTLSGPDEGGGGIMAEITLLWRTLHISPTGRTYSYFLCLWVECVFCTFHLSRSQSQSPVSRHSHLSPVTRHPSPVTRHPSPVTRHPSPVTRHPSPATRHPSPVTRHPSPAT